MLNRLLLSILIVVLSPVATTANLTAPATASVGSLVRIDSDEPAVIWTIQPAQYSASMYVDSNGKAAVLTIPTAGTVYVFAAREGEAGQLLSDCVKIEITDNDKIDVVPFPPVDPVPAPEPRPLTFVEQVKAEVDNLDGDKKDAEKEAFLSVLDATVKFVDNGQVRTTTGIRETIRRNWQLRAITIAPDVYSRWESVTNTLLDGLDKDNPANAKKQLIDVIAALKEGDDDR